MSLTAGDRAASRNRAGSTSTASSTRRRAQALLEAEAAVDGEGQAGPDDVSGHLHLSAARRSPEEQAKLPFLGYRNMLEKVAERYHTTPERWSRLNGPDKLIGPGQTLRLPNVVPDVARLFRRSRQGREADEPAQRRRPPAAGRLGRRRQERGRAQGARRRQGDRAGRAIPGDDGLDPRSAAARRLEGDDLRVPAAVPLPAGPVLGRQGQGDEQKLPPGPNGPVGVAWLDLTKEHYGIHGTPEPQTIGQTESHGCIRMTNWDVMRLARMMKPGFTAEIRGIGAHAEGRRAPRVVTAVADQRLLDLVLHRLPARRADPTAIAAAGDVATVDPQGGRRWRSPKGVDGRPGRARHPGRRA